MSLGGIKFYEQSWADGCSGHLVEVFKSINNPSEGIKDIVDAIEILASEDLDVSTIPLRVRRSVLDHLVSELFQSIEIFERIDSNSSLDATVKEIIHKVDNFDREALCSLKNKQWPTAREIQLIINNFFQQEKIVNLEKKYMPFTSSSYLYPTGSELYLMQAKERQVGRSLDDTSLDQSASWGSRSSQSILEDAANLTSKNIGLNTKRDKIRGRCSLSNDAKAKLIERLPKIDKNFKARQDDMANLEKRLQIFSRVCVVSTKEGHRTQLVTDYAIRYQEVYDAVFYIMALDTVSVENQIAEVLAILDCPESDLRFNRKAQMKSLIGSMNRSLCIFDMLDDPTMYSILEELLPTGCNMHVLVTTRNESKKLYTHEKSKYQLPPISMKEAASAIMSATRQAGLDISGDLGRYLSSPLALKLICGLVSSLDIQLTQVLANIKRQIKFKVINHEQIVFQVVINQLRSYVFVRKIILIIYLTGGLRIPEVLFTALDKDINKVRESLDILVRVGILSRDDNHQYYNMHPSYQQIASQKKIRSEHKQITEIILQGFKTLASYYKYEDSLSWSYLDELHQPFIYFTHRARQYFCDESMEQVESLQILFAFHMMESSRLVDAKNLLERDFVDASALLKPLADLLRAHLWHYGSDYSKAISDLDAFIKSGPGVGDATQIKELLIQMGYLSPNSSDAQAKQLLQAMAYNIRGNAYYGKRELDKAYQASLDAENILSQSFPAYKCSYYSIIWNDRGWIQKCRTFLDDAAMLLEKALDHRKSYLDDNHPLLAVGYTNAANALLSSKKPQHLDVARGNLKKAEEIYSISLKYNHPRLAWLNDAFGMLYYASAGDDPKGLEKAKTAFKSAYQIRKKAFMPDHVYIPNSLYRLGQIALEQDNLGEAKELLEEALEIRKRHITSSDFYSEDSLEMVDLYEELSKLKTRFLKLSDVCQSREKAVNICERLFEKWKSPEMQTRLVINYINLGVAYVDTRQWKLAVEFFNKALDKGESGPFLPVIHSNLAICNHKQGDYSNAMRYYKKAYSKRSRFVYKKDCTLVIINYCTLLIEIGEAYKAIEYIVEYLASSLKVADAKSIVNAKLRLTLGNAYLSRRQYESAEMQFGEAKKLNQSSTNYTELSISLAMVELYIQQNRYSDAFNLAKKSLAKAQEDANACFFHERINNDFKILVAYTKVRSQDSPTSKSLEEGIKDIEACLKWMDDNSTRNELALKKIRGQILKAGLLRLLGHFNQAITAYQHAEGGLSRLLGHKKHRFICDCLLGASLCHQKIGQLNQAGKLREEANGISIEMETQQGCLVINNSVSRREMSVTTGRVLQDAAKKDPKLNGQLSGMSENKKNDLRCSSSDDDEMRHSSEAEEYCAGLEQELSSKEEDDSVWDCFKDEEVETNSELEDYYAGIEQGSSSEEEDDSVWDCFKDEKVEMNSELEEYYASLEQEPSSEEEDDSVWDCFKDEKIEMNSELEEYYASLEQEPSSEEKSDLSLGCSVASNVKPNDEKELQFERSSTESEKAQTISDAGQVIRQPLDIKKSMLETFDKIDGFVDAYLKESKEL